MRWSRAPDAKPLTLLIHFPLHIDLLIYDGMLVLHLHISNDDSASGPVYRRVCSCETNKIEVNRFCRDTPRDKRDIQYVSTGPEAKEPQR